MAKKADIQELKDEFERWKPLLQNYQLRFKENYKRYSGYFDQSGTDVEIADPVAFELVERMNQRLFEKEPKFYAESTGFNLPREVKRVITSLAENYIWNNQNIIATTGPMRSKLKVIGREFCVTGNTGTETYWNVIADAPDLRTMPIEDIVFDPSKTLKTSHRYYIVQWVNLQYLEDNVEIKENGQVVTGIFDSAAIKKIKRLSAGAASSTNSSHQKPDPGAVYLNRTGTNIQRQVDEYQLISCWDSKHCTRFVYGLDEPVGVMEFDSILEDDPLDFAMDIEVVKEPYAMSIIDPQAGLFKAKDLILSQTIDYGSKVLNPPTIVNPSIGAINLKTVANMYKLGGIVLGDPAQIKQEVPSTAPQTAGLEMMNYIEQRAESISGVGAYSAGISNQPNDRTQGTAAGIEALQSASLAPIHDRQMNIEESIIEPFINKALKMIGATMSDTDFKWVMITGAERSWVKVTKGFLTGKIRMTDLMAAGVIEDQEVAKVVQSMKDQGKNPEKDIMFDVDWVIKVETGSMADSDLKESFQNKKTLVDLATEMQIPIDKMKIWKDMAIDAGIKEPDQYIVQPQDQKGAEVEQGQNAAGAPGPIQRTPSETISFKDLPPDGQVQMAQQAGIQIQPQQPQMAPAPVSPQSKVMPHVGQ